MTGIPTLLTGVNLTEELVSEGDVININRLEGKVLETRLNYLYQNNLIDELLSRKNLKDNVRDKINEMFVA